MSKICDGNGNCREPEPEEDDGATEDVRNIPTGDLIVALFFCVQNEFSFIHNLEMMNAAPPQQQQDLQFISQFKDIQAQLGQTKDAREKIVQEFNERYAPADNLRRAMVEGPVDLGFGQTGKPQ